MNARHLSFALAVAGVCAFSGCEPLPGKPTSADVDLAPDKVTSFSVLYGENCAGCHGADGQGNGSLALANPVYLAIVPDDALRRAMAQGIVGTMMPPFAQSSGGMLTDAQIDIIAKGIRTNWSKPNALNGATPPPYAAAGPGNVPHGAEVNTVFCASCHGASGEGTAKAGSIVDASYLALVSEQGLRTTIIAGRPELGHPDWRNCVSNRVMTAEEITDVVAWMASHRSATPGRPYVRGQ